MMVKPEQPHRIDPVRRGTPSLISQRLSQLKSVGTVRQHQTTIVRSGMSSSPTGAKKNAAHPSLASAVLMSREGSYISSIGPAKPIPIPTPVAIIYSIFDQVEQGRQIRMRPPVYGFRKPDQHTVDSYDLDVVNAIREANVPRLRQYLSEGKTMNACNRFGESLMHMACRRGDITLVRFLVEEANVRLDICDDFGRTPFHDACWTTKPNFDLMDVLIQAAHPELLLSEDVRRHTPFHYARREHWDQWAQFIQQREVMLKQKLSTLPLV